MPEELQCNGQARASGAPPAGPQSALHLPRLGGSEEFPIGLHPAGESGTVVSFFHPGPVSPEMFETLSLLASRNDRWAVIRAALEQADSGSFEITPEVVSRGAEALLLCCGLSDVLSPRRARAAALEAFRAMAEPRHVFLLHTDDELLHQ